MLPLIETLDGELWLKTMCAFLAAGLIGFLLWLWFRERPRLIAKPSTMAIRPTCYMCGQPDCPNPATTNTAKAWRDDPFAPVEYGDPVG